MGPPTGRAAGAGTFIASACASGVVHELQLELGLQEQLLVEEAWGMGEEEPLKGWGVIIGGRGKFNCGGYGMGLME